MTSPRTSGAGRGAVEKTVGAVWIIIALGIIADIVLLALIAQNYGFWWLVAAVLVGWLVATTLVLTAGRQALGRFAALRDTLRGVPPSTRANGRPTFTLFAALLFYLPGPVTDVLGAIVLLKPVQDLIVRRFGWEGNPPPGSRRTPSSGPQQVESDVIEGVVVDSRPLPEPDGPDHHSAGPEHTDGDEPPTSGRD